MLIDARDIRGTIKATVTRGVTTLLKVDKAFMLSLSLQTKLTTRKQRTYCQCRHRCGDYAVAGYTETSILRGAPSRARNRILEQSPFALRQC
jgi:hypothetical protein